MALSDVTDEELVRGTQDSKFRNVSDVLIYAGISRPGGQDFRRARKRLAELGIDLGSPRAKISYARYTDVPENARQAQDYSIRPPKDIKPSRSPSLPKPPLRSSCGAESSVRAATRVLISALQEEIEKLEVEISDKKIMISELENLVSNTIV